MNFLAHVYLSGDDLEIAFGNFIGDFVKGDYKSKYPEKIALGISLHREIDFFTDNHKIFKTSKSRLKSIYGHYPPVIIDIFYDHILAKNWGDYHDMDLKSFTKKFYHDCHPLIHLIPEKGQELFKYMVRQDWLYNYSRIEGIKKTFEGLSSRSSFESNMNKATDELTKLYLEFKKDFELFFPEVIEFSKKIILKSIN